jgi:hypothetical protein
MCTDLCTDATVACRLNSFQPIRTHLLHVKEILGKNVSLTGWPSSHLSLIFPVPLEQACQIPKQLLVKAKFQLDILGHN